MTDRKTPDLEAECDRLRELASTLARFTCSCPIITPEDEAEYDAAMAEMRSLGLAE
jgi:hypothetical protein